MIKCEIHGYDFKNNAETCIQCSKNKHFYDYSTIGGIKEAYNKDTKGGNSWLSTKKLFQYLWCCISPNSHVISGEEEDRLSTEKQVFICKRCKTGVLAWEDKWCKENEYWIREVD